MKFFPKFLIKLSASVLLISLAFSCSQKPVRIENHYNQFFNKSASYAKKRSQNNYSSKSTSSRSYNKNSGFSVKVQPGDNLYKISKQYNSSIYDIIKANDLQPPYFLMVGQSLNIPVSQYHKIEPGETLYSVSRDYNMTLTQLVRLNNLQSPYILKTGSNLKIAGNIPSTSQPQRNKSSEVVSGVISHNLLKSNNFIWPVKGQIISKFGAKSGGLYNDGINIKAKVGDPIKSAEDGVVAYVGNELKGYGNLIIIKHSGGWITAYAHLNSFDVKRGQKVAQSAQIGTVGITGNVSEAQLYFSLRKGRDALNPQNYLK